ncbi:unnamed protein product [Acanthoscelides obtectus]|uniref:Uncharacterized protein n=1 Tax=Acanthoscelides obtectus TaxID=200917 RepID=A0A9P0NRR4_ACAOB|nr:unnamed protein product [Acanthoscelides obtectus]CAK1661450.1 hypothetical protein AOBTE_LOCUS22633 [Acanthoscelides obtectus]
MPKKVIRICSEENFKKELEKIYDEMRRQNVPEEDIKKYFFIVTKNMRFFNIFDYIIIFSSVIMIFLCMLSYFESVSWYSSALGRIYLIKLLPIYDWTHLKNKPCLIERTEMSPIASDFECGSCENIQRLDVYDYLDEDDLEERYINLDIPVIITKSLEHWPKDSDFLDIAIRENSFFFSYPCRFSGNVHKGHGNVGEILDKVKHFNQFYIHFQNCNLEAMRIFRKYTFRPAVIPRTYSPTTYNWLLWNKDYNTTNYKPIQLIEKLTAFGQVFGSTHVKLVPRKNCKTLCPTLNIKLFAHELLVFTSLWDLEYKPTESGENMAIVMEIKS